MFSVLRWNLHTRPRRLLLISQAKCWTGPWQARRPGPAPLALMGADGGAGAAETLEKGRWGGEEEQRANEGRDTVTHSSHAASSSDYSSKRGFEIGTLSHKRHISLGAFFFLRADTQQENPLTPAALLQILAGLSCKAGGHTETGGFNAAARLRTLSSAPRANALLLDILLQSHALLHVITHGVVCLNFSSTGQIFASGDTGCYSTKRVWEYEEHEAALREAEEPELAMIKHLLICYP